MKLQSTIEERAGFLYTAPLLDGVLLLLVFFVLGSTFVSKSGVEVSLPTSDSALPDARHSHIITVLGGASEKLFFNDYRVNIDQLNNQLQASKGSSNQITILADKNVEFGVAMEVALLCLKYGYEVAFGTQPAPQ